ncbi:hypothetical protein G6F65_022162 [Rhizopus arrhizus]|nr:hypothetical protein G6F65_022162 [Rhizopus arrhizus]
MLQPTEDTRSGLSYRSKIKHTAKGDTDITSIGPTKASRHAPAERTVGAAGRRVVDGLEQHPRPEDPQLGRRRSRRRPAAELPRHVARRRGRELQVRSRLEVEIRPGL